jgi:two-component sensor histidine kinase
MKCPDKHQKCQSSDEQNDALRVGSQMVVLDRKPQHRIGDASHNVDRNNTIGRSDGTSVQGRSSNLPALLLAPLPFLVWAAVRVGVGGTGLTLLVVAGIAVADAYLGRGPLINRAPEVNVFSLQVFLTAISIPILLLAAVVEERRQAEEALKQNSKQVEQALAERSLQLALAGKAALVGSYAYDVGNDMMQVDAGYAALHGLPEGTVKTARSEWRARTLPEDLIRVEDMRERAFREALGEYDIEYRIVLSSGEVRWIESRSFVTYTSEGRPQRIAGVNIDITGRKRADDHLRMLVAELDHRVKNALATVSAVTSRTHDASGSMADFVTALDGRIRSMAATHQLLSSQHWKGILLSDLIRRELAPYAAHGNTDIGGPDEILKADVAQALSMVLHELSTNAAKYGALSAPGGRISVGWHRVMNGDADARLCIEWQESGGPAVQAPDGGGYGMEVIRNLLPYELDAKVDLAFASAGVRCCIDIPVSQLARGLQITAS